MTKDEFLAIAKGGDVTAMQDACLQDAVIIEKWGESALIAAAEKNLKPIVEFLINQGVNPNAMDGEALVNAAERGRLSMVKFLISKGARPDAWDGCSLVFAARNGHLLTVKFLMSKGVSADVQNSLALAHASRRGHQAMVELLISKGADVNARDGAAVCNSCYLKHDEIFNLLIRSGAMPNIGNIRFNEISNLSILKHLIRYSNIRDLEFDRIIQETAGSPVPAIKNFCAELLSEFGFETVNPDVKNESEFQSAVMNSFSNGPIKSGLLPTLMRLNLLEKEIRSIESQNLAAGTESSMDTNLMKLARETFDKKIIKDERLNNLFEQKGGTTGIESDIKSLLLDRIQRDSVDNEVKGFIDTNKAAILNHQSPEAAVFGTLIANDNTSTAAIAFRAYDPKAPVVAWPNLFTAPSPSTSTQSVFSTSLSSGRGALNLEQASNEIRKMAAYYYLCILGDNDGFDRFVAYVAECRRAHNENSKGEDNPSCFPGHITRLARIPQSAEHKIEAPVAIQVRELIRDAVVQRAAELFRQHKDNKETLSKHYDALTMLHHGYESEAINAAVLRDLYNKKVSFHSGEPRNADGDRSEVAELIELREKFIHNTFGHSSDDRRSWLLKALESRELSGNSTDLTLIEKYAELYMLQISHADALGSLAADYIRKIRDLDTSMHMDTSPVDNDSDINNPFVSESWDKYLGRLPLQMRAQATELAYIRNLLRHAIAAHLIHQGRKHDLVNTSIDVIEAFEATNEGKKASWKKEDLESMTESAISYYQSTLTSFSSPSNPAVLPTFDAGQPHKTQSSLPKSNSEADDEPKHKRRKKDNP